MKTRHWKEFSVTEGNSNEHIHFSSHFKMKYLRAKIMKWKIKKSKEQYSRINEFSDQFVDAIYENDFELAKILVDDGKVNVNIKNDCGDTPLIAFVSRRHYRMKKRLSCLLIIYGRAVLNSTHQINQGRQPWIMRRAMIWRILSKIWSMFNGWVCMTIYAI